MNFLNLEWLLSIFVNFYFSKEHKSNVALCFIQNQMTGKIKNTTKESKLIKRWLMTSTELPFGWEEVEDAVLGKYYIDHNNRKYYQTISYV